MSASQAIKIRRLPDGPAHITNRTRYKEKWLYNWQEADRELRHKARNKAAVPKTPPAQVEHWTGHIHFCECGKTTDHRKEAGSGTVVLCSGCGRRATLPVRP